jgi:hypothetical protein
MEGELLYNWVKEQQTLRLQDTIGNINKGVRSLECQSSELITSRADKSSYIHRMTQVKWLSALHIQIKPAQDNAITRNDNIWIECQYFRDGKNLYHF